MKITRWRLLVPFAIGSVPAAFVGGLKLLSPKAFSLVLGVTLLLSATRLAWMNRPVAAHAHLPARTLWMFGPPIGVGLGLLAGMVGVGEVYRMYASGELMDDDEVALAHGDEDSGYRPASEPMVNLRNMVVPCC